MIVLSVYNHDQLGWRCMDQFYILPSEPSPSGAPYQVAPLVADCHCVSLLLWHEYKGRRSANMHTSNANTSNSSRKNAAINILLVFCLFNLSNCKSCSWIVSYRLDYWMSKAPSWLLNSTLMRLQHWYTNLHLIYTIRNTSTWDDCRIYIYISNLNIVHCRVRLSLRSCGKSAQLPIRRQQKGIWGDTWILAVTAINGQPLSVKFAVRRA